uniref:hypothetical protein n=1 Tax=Alcaligenes faecalis TaxID=511 RepID=UPI00155DC276|nr:hypothetical protein [Alcaligenes faecalis]
MRSLVYFLVLVVVGYMTIGTLQLKKDATVMARFGNEIITYKGDFKRNILTGTYSVTAKDGSTTYFDRSNFVGASWLN